jgi:hypothetical protein
MKKQLLLTTAVIIGFSFAASSFAMTTYGPTKEGDTVWKLAHHYHIKGVRVNQLASAIEALNQSSFAHNGSLKLGKTLSIPTTKAEVVANTTASKASASSKAAKVTSAPAAATPATSATPTTSEASVTTEPTINETAATQGTRAES